MLGGKLARERRVFERLPIRCPLKFKSEGKDVLTEGSVKDFSDGGIGLFTRSRLAPNTPLEMWIKLFPKTEPLHIAGRVVWVDQRQPDLWYAGICFYEMAFIKLVKMLVGKSSSETKQELS